MSLEKERFENLIRSTEFKKLKEAHDFTFPNAVWWYLPKLTSSVRSVKQAEQLSAHFFGDGRSRQGRWKALVALLQKKISPSTPFIEFQTPRFGRVWAGSLCAAGQIQGYVILTDLKAPVPSAWFKLLHHAADQALESHWRGEEINRLSATIRPRAIALSTVHTVHRIINSTLNLDELISRLGHLTAQVLRVNRCAIYLLDSKATPQGKSSKLLCKALVGYPGKKKIGHSIRVGQQMEGKIARSADIQLRRKVLCIPLIDEDVIGVVTVTGKKDKKDFNHFDLEILTTLAEEAVIAIKNAQLYEEQRRVTLSTIRSLAVILGSRMPQSTGMPSELYVKLALDTAAELRLSEEQTQAIHYAALLKETTKIGIPEEILTKTEKLTGEEMSLLRAHPIHGAKIVQNFESLKSVAPIILYSREKFDGSGYPEGLTGEAIPMGSRVLSVLNAFEAIVIGRPYRGRSVAESDVIRELSQNSGTQFDPRVVEAFIRVVKKDNVVKRLRNASSV